jgi:SAM-dependent methyltransferase
LHRTGDIVGAPSQWPKRLARVWPALACPACRCDLISAETEVVCCKCGRQYPVRDGKIYFIEPPTANDALDHIKQRLKRLFGRNYYRIGVQIIAPTYPFNYLAAIRRHGEPERQLIIDLGCGNNRVDDDLVSLDSIDYAAVDIVADVAALPFKSESLDGFASRSVLEHLPDLAAALEEIRRCTKPGGVSLHLIPFLFPYHASPHDYQRLTHSGAARLFPGWQLLEQRNATGPVTLFVVTFSEFLAILLSFGKPRLKAVFYLLVCLLLFPLKFLDAPFIGRDAFLSLAPTIYTALRKS